MEYKVNVRPELYDFVIAMEKKLQEREEKYGESWKHMSIVDLEDKLQEEINEFDEAIDSWPELVDIANVCMMLWNRGK